uniref:GIY-YIG endonuclease n=1 Tax=Clavaria fumosa TaxID=264083 RepID=A0A7T3PCS9_9AGAR|nr:GIY-YIG endonuclease [Clavaria fumosa]QPZ51149.1 GIY-YIG endonuclease [Clavaria fumosa]
MPINLIIIFDLKILNCFFFLHYEEFNYMNIFDLYCLEIIPIVSYNDALFNKNKIILDNKGKAGIYCWTLLSANKSYIGSSVNLGRRLRDYLNPIYISHYSRKNMVINRALLKHGYSNFKLEILEYCNPKDLVKKEQHYLDILTPEYNVLNTAYSSLGYKHTKESLLKIKKQLAILNKSKSISVKVTNLKTNVSYEYTYLTTAVKNLNINKNTLQRYILKSKLFKGIYKLESSLSISNFDSNYLNHPNSIEIEITDLKLNTVTRYTSMLSAARALWISGTTISNFIKRNQTKPYKERFIFKQL